MAEAPARGSADKRFLDGGGECGALIASRDWSATSLGPIERWPQSLRTATSILLRSPVPIVMLWGEDGVMIYNDAYSAFAGGRHPQLLGSKVREGWPEVADFNDHAMKVGLAGDTLAYKDQELTLYRHGEPEQVWMNLDYSPVLDERGVPAGVLAIVVETTERVLAERATRANEGRLRFLDRLREATQSLSVASEIMAVTARLLGEQLAADVCAYADMEADQDHFTIRGDWTAQGSDSIVGTYSLAAFGPTALKALRSGCPFVTRDALAELGPEEASLLLQLGLQATVCMPLVKAGRLAALMAVHSATPRDWSEHDLALIAETTERSWAHIERTRSEAVAREGEARLGAALTAASLGTFDWAVPTGAVELDDRSREIFRFAASEGHTETEIFARIHPDDLPRVHAEAMAAVERASRLETEYRIKLPDGTVRIISSISEAVPGPGGEAERIVGVFKDITDRRQTEEALRASEARFQAIANSIDQMIWATRPDGYHDYFNDRWYEYTGVPDGSTDGEGWNDIFHPDDQDRALEVWHRSLATGEPYHIEYRLRHRSGRYRWVIGRAQPVRDAAGRIARWYGTCTDVHDLKTAEAELRQLNETLERRVAERTADRDRMWRLSTDLMLVARFDATINAVNPAWTTLLGWHEEELIGRPFTDFIHPDDIESTLAEAARLADGLTTLRFENRYRHHNGDYSWLSWTAVPDEQFIHALARDVTAEKAAAAELEQIQEALRQSQKMEAIGQLTGGVAHDFNNLLTVIRSSADLLRRHELTEEKRRRYVDAIAETADRAAKLTGQLLAFARRQALKPEVFDVGERVQAIADMLRTVVGSRIELVADNDCETCYAEADTTQFETALVNMAVNARDAMDGQGRLTISVVPTSTVPRVRGHHAAGGAFVAVSVSDTGHGIEPDKLSHIFEPFFTTKEVGKGTGLGLSQVYGFAKQSGGEVDVESRVGHGTTFTLYLPRVEPAKRDERGDGSRGATALAQGHVLVVEDNEQVGTFSTQLLAELGFETTWAANADAALTLLDERAGDYAAVFSDVVMPGMSGVELGLEIRRRWPNLPVVLTSGYSHVLAQEGRHGFELLQKPYSAEDLTRILHDAIGQRDRR